MQTPFDTELVTGSVYVVVVPLYLLVWRHSRHWYVGLAFAALVLGMCALLRSETVRAWRPPSPHHGVEPLSQPHDFGLLAAIQPGWDVATYWLPRT